MPFFQDLGKALLWLRLDKQRKQNEVAQAAGITQAMLCSYEKGKRTPSLDSLGKVLSTLGVSLAELEKTLLKVGQTAGRPPAGTAPPRGAGEPPQEERGSVGATDLYDLLGQRPPLPEPAEAALEQMVHGFADWLRFVADATPQARRAPFPGSRKTVQEKKNPDDDPEKGN
jgi:transcriptional regulator with XRE-family HTH domain